MKKKSHVILLVLLGILLAAVTSYYYPLGGDEYHHVIAVKELASGNTDLSGALEDIPFWYPLIWHLMAAGVYLLFGSVLAIKGMQLLLGISLIFLTHKLLSKFKVHRTIKNYTIISLSLYIGWIIHSARLYVDIIIPVFITLSLIMYFKWTDNPNLRNSGLLALTLMVTSLTHVHAVFIFPAILLADLVCKHKIHLKLWAIFVAGSLPFIAWWSQNNFLEPSQLSPAMNSIFNLKLWFFFYLPKLFVYGIWLGVPNAEEAYFRAALFSNLPQIGGINPLWVWTIPAGILSMVMLAGVLYLMLHRDELGNYLMIIGAVFLLPFFVKGFIRIFIVPSLVVLAFIFANGWYWIEMECKRFHIRKFARTFILALLILFALQGPVIAYNLHKEKADLPVLAEYAQQIIPADAKVYTPVEYTRNKLYLERNLTSSNTLTIQELHEDLTQLDGHYIYIDSWMFMHNRLNTEEQRSLDAVVKTPCVKLVSELVVQDSWEKIYRIECS